MAGPGFWLPDEGAESSPELAVAPNSTYVGCFWSMVPYLDPKYPLDPHESDHEPFV